MTKEECDRNVEAAGLLIKHGYPREALPMLRAALRSEPRNHKALVNIGVASRLLGHFPAAQVYLQMAIAASSHDSGPAWNNLGMVYEDIGKFEEAHSCYAAGYAKLPQAQEIQLSLAYALMRLQRFREAWPLWEGGRLLKSWYPLPNLPILEVGESVAGKRVVVMPEGGFGDAILSWRWLRHLAEQAASLTVVVWDEILNLLAFQKHKDPCQIPIKLTAFGRTGREELNAARYEAQCGLLSVPAVLGLSDVDSLTADDGVSWFGPPFCRNRWAHFAPAGGPLRVGLCWRAEERLTARKHRIVPVEQLSRMAGVEGVEWYSLCPQGPGLRDDSVFETPPWVRPDETQGWEDTAGLIANLDLVISVDTAVAHLAGAMRKPTWIVVPRRSHWVWFTEGESSPWYPTVRLFRQDDPLRWRPTIRQVAKALEGYVLAHQNSQNSTPEATP